MAIKLTLYQKGIIVIGVPLLIQVGFFALYTSMLEQSDALDRLDYHAKNVVGRCHWISVLILSATLGWFVYRDTNDKQVLAIYEHGKSNLPKSLSQIADVVSTDKDQVKLVSRAQELTDKLLSKLQSHREPQTPVIPNSATQKFVSEELMPIFVELYQIRHDLLSTENTRFKLQLNYLPQMRRQEREFIKLGILLDVFIALILFLVFTRGIVKRLQVLTDNTVRFAEKRTLSPPLQGSDEVVLLDQRFHEMARALEQSERRKQEYIQMINHDLRTPLSSVLCSLELLAMPDFGLTEEGAEYLVKSERNLHRCLSLINELLETERMEAGAIEPDFAEMTTMSVVTASVDAVRHLADVQEVEIAVPDSSFSIVADAARLTQVMINLLGNAIKFSPPHSKIVIHVEQSNGLTKFSVSDQGRGIPASHVDKIFSRFQQVEESDSTEKGGSGLGLAICKAIIAAHNGRIGVQSIEGKGSTFWFELPDAPS